MSPSEVSAEAQVETVDESPAALGLFLWGGKTRLERFWSKVDKSGECWLWTASKSGPNGYGQLGDWRFRCQGIPIRAHILSWSIANNRWPNDGEVVRHSCDVKACVRPDHLLIGTHADNMRDARERRRHPMWAAADDRAEAVKRELAGLTTAQARVVDALRRVPQPSPAALAREFGVSRQAVDQLIHRLADDGLLRKCKWQVVEPALVATGMTANVEMEQAVRRKVAKLARKADNLSRRLAEISQLAADWSES